MSPFEREQVEAVCYAWFCHSFGYHNDIPKEGKTILADYVDLGGVYSSEGYKPELVSKQAEKMRYHELSDFMKYSTLVFEELTIDQRQIAIAKFFYTRRDPQKENLTTRQIAKALELTFDQYRDRLRNTRAKVLRIDKKLRPHVYPKPKEPIQEQEAK